MAIKLNLLPPELEVNKNLGSFLKTAKSLGVIGVVLFLFFGVGLAVFFIASTLSLNSVNANVAKLSGQVSAMQKSEQQIMLVKDRIAKVVSIQALPNSLTNMTAIDPYLSNLSATASVSQLDISPESVDVSLLLRTYSDVTNFLESVQSSITLGSVSLESFNYNPVAGYSIEIKTAKK